jgi:hypothetical protein
MGRLTIHLQDGFVGDTVSVRVDGKEVFHKTGVRTKLPLGYADVFETEVPEGGAHVEVEVPSRHLSDSFQVQADPRAHVGISIHNDKVGHLVSRKAFGYM